jgi:hypothetical protein
MPAIPGSWNRYSFAGADPVTNSSGLVGIDQTGRFDDSGNTVVSSVSAIPSPVPVNTILSPVSSALQSVGAGVAPSTQEASPGSSNDATASPGMMMESIQSVPSVITPAILASLSGSLTWFPTPAPSVPAVVSGIGTDPTKMDLARYSGQVCAAIGSARTVSLVGAGIGAASILLWLPSSGADRGSRCGWHRSYFVLRVQRCRPIWLYIMLANAEKITSDNYGA